MDSRGQLIKQARETYGHEKEEEMPSGNTMSRDNKTNSNVKKGSFTSE